MISGKAWKIAQNVVCDYPPSYHMSEEIRISDDVYRRLKREKGDKSFSEVIAAVLDESTNLMDVSGVRVLDQQSMDQIKKIGKEHECNL